MNTNLYELINILSKENQELKKMNQELKNLIPDSICHKLLDRTEMIYTQIHHIKQDISEIKNQISEIKNAP